MEMDTQFLDYIVKGLVDNPNPETTWYWLSFGKNKAKAIGKYFNVISSKNRVEKVKLI